MDPRFLDYYNRELQYIREVGGEFAKQYPKIAGRLGLEGFECADPYVERLLEGFSFLAARIQLKLDAEYPQFAQHLLEMVYPDYLRPIPSMAMVKFAPELAEGSLAEGFEIPRQTALRSILGKGDQTPCEYRTAHPVTLWPLELSEVEYLSGTGTVARLGVPEVRGMKAAIRLRLRTTAGLTFEQLALDRLPVYLRGADEFPMRVYEQLLANAVGVVVRPANAADRQTLLPGASLQPVGFSADEALLPYSARSFQGYRLVQEYFAFPQRFMFVAFSSLRAPLSRCDSDEVELIAVLNRNDAALDKALAVDNFELFCTPAINLFPKRGDRIHLDQRNHEYHIVPDRTRPMDFEVSSVNSVTGYGTSGEGEQAFRPFYAANDLTHHTEDAAYYTLRRAPRTLSAGQRTRGSRSSYIGSEVHIALVDGLEAPYSSDLRQLGLELSCTNRDLPLQMPVGKGKTDFTLELGAPVESIRCVAGPTKPRDACAQGSTAWSLISHLSLNYLSLLDSEPDGAAALREMLTLYGDLNDLTTRKQVEGIVSIESKPVTRRIPLDGPVSIGRGLSITVTFDEASFEGTGVMLLGTVLERFFAKYVSLNSFTETTLRTVDRGEVMKWPVRIGQRQTL